MARDEHKLFPFPSTPSAHGAEWIKYFLERLLSVALSPLQVKFNFPFALSSPLTFHPKILVQIFYCLRWARGKKDFRLPIQFHFKFLLAKRKVAVPRPIPPSTGSCFMHVRQYVLRAFEGPFSRYNQVGWKFTNFDWIGWRKASESISSLSPPDPFDLETNIKCYCYAWRDAERTTMSSEAFSLSLSFGTRWMMKQGKLLWKGFRDANRKKKLLALSVV